MHDVCVMLFIQHQWHIISCILKTRARLCGRARVLISEWGYGFPLVILSANGKCALWNKVWRSNKEVLCLIPVECAETAA